MRFRGCLALCLGFLFLDSVFGERSLSDPDKMLRRTRRVIDGELADVAKFPFIVSIQAKISSDFFSRLSGEVEHFCGGTLIAPRWILTAAHCMYAYTDDGKQKDLRDPKIWHVRLATDKLKPSMMDRVKGFLNRAFNVFFGYRKPQAFYHLEKVILHPDYVSGYLENDIALLKIREHILVHRMKSLEILEMPDPQVVGKIWPKTGQNCSAVGWGSACLNCPPEMYMRVISVPIVDPVACRRMYSVSINLTETSEFCAGYLKKNKGVCSGDSGGPLVCEFAGKKLLAGVTSAIHAKRPEDYPAVFTRVVRFSEWISEVIGTN